MSARNGQVNGVQLRLNLEQRSEILKAKIEELNLMNELLEEVPMVFDNPALYAVHKAISLRSLQYQEEQEFIHSALSFIP